MKGGGGLYYNLVYTSPINKSGSISSFIFHFVSSVHYFMLRFFSQFYLHSLLFLLHFSGSQTAPLPAISCYFGLLFFYFEQFIIIIKPPTEVMT